MNNNSTPVNKSQAKNDSQSVNLHTLEMVSVNALVPLSSAIYELSDTPLQTLSYLHRLLRRLYKQNREQDCIDLLCLAYSVLGIEYADVFLQMHKHPEIRSNFLYGFISNVAELIEELSERGNA